MGRGMIAGWYGKRHVLIFLSYTSDKLFYEANKQNEINKWLYKVILTLTSSFSISKNMDMSLLYFF
jgi:hypothetical protein